MTRHFFWVTAVLTLSLGLVTYEQRAIAQEAGDASAESEADTNATDADTSADASANDTSGQANAEADASANDADAASADAQSSSSDDSGSTSDSAGPALPPPSDDAASATTDQNAASESQDETADSQDASVDAQSDQASGTNAADRADRSSADDVNADSRNNAEAFPPAGNASDANVDRRQERSRLIERDQPDADARRSRTDANARGRTDVNMRAGRDTRANLRGGIQFGRSTDRGLTVNHIERNSFYYDSGLRRGDVIISVHGRPVHSDTDFMRYIIMQPGQRVPVVVMRDGDRETIFVQYENVAQTQRAPGQRQQQSGGAYLGVTFDPQARDAAVVLSVNPGSPAQEAGVQAGDIIVALNGEEVRSYPDVISIVRTMRPGDELEIIVERARAEQQIVAVLDSPPSVRTAARPDVRVERETRIVEPRNRVEVDVDDRDDDDDDRRLLDRDRDNDGATDRRLLPRLRD